MTIDLSKLDVETRARQLGKLEGEVGLAMAESLNIKNANAYEFAFRSLSLRRSDRILEIGFGNGHLISRLLTLAEDLSYVGIDISETMVSEAIAFNKGVSLDVRVGSSSAIPFSPGEFDRVLAINTIYFWSDPSRDLAEIRRVLRPNGKLVLGAFDPAGTRTNPVFAYGFKFYETEELSQMLKAAGFLRVAIEVFNEVRQATDGSEFATDYFMVSANVD
jgi:SAM-dependent methyltransferase